MRDLIAGLVALILLVVATSLATTLHYYRRRRRRARDSEQALGRRVIAELPVSEDLTLFSEDDVRFYYGERSIDKDLITAARLMINGNVIAEAVREGGQSRQPNVVIHDRPEGIARDRWDVAIVAVNGTTVIECGAIRERVSQELARAVFDAVKRTIDDGPRHHSISGTRPR